MPGRSRSNSFKVCAALLAGGAKALSCRDPDANEQIFVEDKEIQPIMEAKTGPMVPWTRLW